MNDMSQAVSAVKSWRDDPVMFVREILKAQPEAWQLEALKNYAKGDRLTIRSGHGVGKSTFLAWCILHFLMTRYPAKVPCTSPSASQMFDVLWSEVRLWQQRMPKSLGDQVLIKSDRIEIAGAALECFASARTARSEKPDALQGFHSENLLFVVDEASGVDDIIFEVAGGALSTHGAKLIMTGNPLRNSGYFHRSHQPTSDFIRMHVNAEDVPRARGAAAEFAKNYGIDSMVYRVRVLGEFPNNEDDTLIPLELTWSAVDREVTINRVACIWGVDVARYGTDSTVLCKRWPRGMTEEPKVWSNLSTMEVVGRIKHEWDCTPQSEQPEAICVDVIGIGAGVVDRLLELKLPIIGVNVAETPSSELELADKQRDELWLKAKRWLEGRDVKLPKHERLINELSSVRKSFGSNGKIKIESKDAMKKRGLRSPDVADAFNLTFAHYSTNDLKSSRSAGYQSDWSKPITRGAEGTYV
jgi:hypothetical protein